MGPIDPHDAVPVPVLKTLLRIDLPQLRPKFPEAFEETVDSCMGPADSSINGSCD